MRKPPRPGQPQRAGGPGGSARARLGTTARRWSGISELTVWTRTQAREGAARILARYAAPRPLAGDAGSPDEEILAQVFRGAATSGSGWARSDRSTLQELVAEYLMGPAARPPSPALPSAGEAARRAATYAWARWRLGVPRISHHVAYHPLDAHLPLLPDTAAYLAGVEPGHSSTAPARAVSLADVFSRGVRGDRRRPPRRRPAVRATHHGDVALARRRAGLPVDAGRAADRASDEPPAAVARRLDSGRIERGRREGRLRDPRAPRRATLVVVGLSQRLVLRQERPSRRRGDARSGAGNAAADPYLFDRDFYSQRYQAGDGGRASAGLDPYLEYLLDGASKWRRPHRLFNSQYYAEKIGAREGQHLFAQYLYEGGDPVSPTPLFDSEFLSRNVSGCGGGGAERQFTDGLHHFLLYGASEGKSPSSDWDPDYYIESNADVRGSLDFSSRPRANAMAFEHFMRFGLAEGRAPSEFFDSKYYVNTYPEVEDEIREYDLLGPFEHFAWIGRKKGYRCREPLHAVEGAGAPRQEPVHEAMPGQRLRPADWPHDNAPAGSRSVLFHHRAMQGQFPLHRASAQALEGRDRLRGSRGRFRG